MTHMSSDPLLHFALSNPFFYYFYLLQDVYAEMHRPVSQAQSFNDFTVLVRRDISSVNTVVPPSCAASPVANLNFPYDVSVLQLSYSFLMRRTRRITAFKRAAQVPPNRERHSR